MQTRHINRKQYFLEQANTTKEFVIPYINSVKIIDKNTKVLEIGCGEGGNLLPFSELGCDITGIDLRHIQIERAQEYFKDLKLENKYRFVASNIYDTSAEEFGQFDVIFLRDVIEHIFDQEKFMQFVQQFLNPKGIIFFGFPPWTMPFGGHQQICRNKILSKLPYYHLLPRSIYKSILKLFKEKEGAIKELLEIKETGISTRRFERIVHENNYNILKKTYWMINPNYQTKFGLKPRKQIGILSILPLLRDFFTTCMYCVIEKKDNK